jgi:hypothetical protein
VHSTPRRLRGRLEHNLVVDLGDLEAIESMEAEQQ